MKIPVITAIASAALCAGIVLCPLSAFAASNDACTILTEGQVSAAAGFTVGKGTHVTPTFLQTCTWTGPSGGGAQIVTLNLQAASFYDGAKRQAGLMAAAGGSMKPAGVGDDSFYAIMGTQVMLWVKKGPNAFKLALYKQVAADQKESIELALAKQALSKF